MGHFQGILGQWQADRNQGLSWQAVEKLPDPMLSSIWSFYQECAKVTPHNYWSLPGAPCGESAHSAVIPRLAEPMAYYTEGLNLHSKLPNPNPSDDLLFTVMHTSMGLLAIEMAAEKMKYTFNEGYEMMCYGMEAVTGQMPKPLGLVMRWAAGVGSLGIAIGRLSEAQAVIVLLAELLEEELEQSLQAGLIELAKHLIEKAYATLEADRLSSFQQKLLDRLPENVIKDTLLTVIQLDSAF